MDTIGRNGAGMIRAVLFDIDGTLIDSNDLHVDAWEKAFAEVDAAPGRNVIRGQIGKGGDNLVPTLLPEADEATQKKVASRHGAIFKAECLDRARAFPMATELLAHVRARGQRVVFASSATARELDRYIDRLDARALVNATVSIDDVARSKPAGDIFSVALDKLALPTEAVIAVGDTPYDARSAEKSGIPTVGVRSGGFDDAALREAGVVALYDDVAALLAGYADSPLAR